MLPLEDFISNKIKNYKPPEKEGVPRGERIGFPREKYHASLLLLSMDSIKEVAKEVNAPYGSVRNWKIEKEFKELADKHANEFAEIFIKTIKKRAKERYKEMTEIFKKPLKEIANLPMSKLDGKELKDMKNYSKFLTSKVLMKFLIIIMEFMGYLLDLLHKGGMKRTERSKFANAMFSTDEKYLTKFRSNPEKYLKNYKYIFDEKETIRAIAMIEELFTAASTILFEVKNTKVEPKTISSQEKKGEGYETGLYYTIWTMPLEIVQGILLSGKPIKEKERKLAVFLLSRAMQTLK